MGAGDGAHGGRKLKFKIIIDGMTLSGSVRENADLTPKPLDPMCGVTVHDVDCAALVSVQGEKPITR